MLITLECVSWRDQGYLIITLSFDLKPNSQDKSIKYERNDMVKVV